MVRVEDKVVLNVEEAAELLRISRTTAYEAVRRGEIPALHIGRRLLIPVQAILRLLNAESSTSDGGGQN